MNIPPAGPVISIFGSHAPEPGSLDYDIAYTTGQLMAKAGYSVATGGYGGTMAAASQGAFDLGGHTIGVTSEAVERSRPAVLNPWIKQEIKYRTLAERVNHLVTVNQGLIVLPGGIGTLSEFALAWSYLQVKEISLRPLILLGTMWSETMNAFVKQEYVASQHLSLVSCVESPEQALAILTSRCVNKKP